MLVVAIILGLFLFILLVVLISPLELRIDTTVGEYYLRWRGLGSARLGGDLDDPWLRLWVLGWRKKFHLWEFAGRPAREKKQEKKEKKAAKKPAGRPRWLTIRFVRRLLRTFRVRQFRLRLDTDDYVTNAYLYPLFALLPGGLQRWRVGFDGHSELVLFLTNRVGKVAWVFLTGILSSKK